jgi:polyvinyl alcohol dehydrogenase (cytochrome)
MSSRTHVFTSLALVFATACSGGASDAGIASVRQAARQAELDVRPGDWPVSTHDAAGSAYSAEEDTLTAANVSRLGIAWVFDAAAAGGPVAAIHATPVVASGRTYVGSSAGTFYAIGKDGSLVWSFVTGPSHPELAAFLPGPAPIFAAAALPETESTVVFGDASGTVYKLDRATGREVWRTSVDQHPFGGIWGAVLVVGDTVYVPLASFETLAPFSPGYTCCSHRGGVAALSLATGTEKWRYETISPSAQGALPPALVSTLGGVETFGPSGGDVWTQPTFDAATNTLFVGTGQLFSRAADGTGPRTYDAVVALDAASGGVRWVTQFSSSLDVYRFDTPNPDPVTGVFSDRDVSGSPKVYTLREGNRRRKVVGVGQKNGEVHVLDAVTGEVVRTTPLLTQVAPEGGFQTGGAVAGGTLFEHGITTPAASGVPYDGEVLGLSLDGGTVKWKVSRPGSPLFGGLSVAGGVVYFQSPFEESAATPGSPETWALYAVDAGSGAVLRRIPFANERAMNGPVVARGRVYAGFGSIVAHGITTANANGGVVCFGLPGEEDD